MSKSEGPHKISYSYQLATVFLAENFAMEGSESQEGKNVIASKD